VLITGTSLNGLGFECARVIAKHANLVIITGYNKERYVYIAWSIPRRKWIRHKAQALRRRAEKRNSWRKYPVSGSQFGLSGCRSCGRSGSQRLPGTDRRETLFQSKILNSQLLLGPDQQCCVLNLRVQVNRRWI
jgi:NAD(P)-dependent dehydrogenase (short-subunit alcohol dehydrogenase family)